MGGEQIEAAKNRAVYLLARMDEALERGEIDEEGWYQEVAAVITPTYLAADNPRGQSGHSGDEAHWEHARSLIRDAPNKSGSSLDVGCASGYLMECVQKWARERGCSLKPYGLDSSPELTSLARTRLPQWADHVYIGNTIEWKPPNRFDFVRTALEYVPNRRQRDLVAHLLSQMVVPGGRLIIETYNEERDELRTGPTVEETVASWGSMLQDGLSGRTIRMSNCSTV